MTLYFSVNREIYGHVTEAHGGEVPVYLSVTCNRGIHSSVTRNILLFSSVPRNIVTYIRRYYIPRLLHQLIEECNIYSSVIELRSLVITEEHILISCSK
jgi:hypothetical protein